MKATPNFFDFIQEDSKDLTRDETRRLEDMGIKPLEPHEAWAELVDDWHADPVVSAALQTLTDKFAELWAEHYRAEYDEAWDQQVEWIVSENRPDDINAFEFFLITHYP